MVDLSKIRGPATKHLPIDPEKIFERQPKPEGVNDLWKSQYEALVAWKERRSEKDLVIKLNTGGGKTLVGLLIAQSVMNEKKVGALYLCATNQLVDQTVAKAREFQLPVVRYEAGAGRPLPSQFENGEATLVATYRALFHGYSKFKVKHRGSPVKSSVIICDDAHTAFSDVRDAFSVVITRKRSETLYKTITSQLRPAADAIGRLGSFDYRVGGQDLGAFEIPFWEWQKVSRDIRDLLLKFEGDSEFQFQLPLIADMFDAAHVIVRSTDVMITPILPPVDLLPTFTECPHRVFMSATIADDSALVRTFDASPEAVLDPIAPSGLAGVGERMILLPALTPVGPTEELKAARQLASHVVGRNLGVVVLAPSELFAKNRWGKAATIVMGDDVATAVERLTDRTAQDNGPYVLVNRYDGVDLAKDACRLLIMDGMPRGGSAYDEYRANTLRGSSQIELSLAQRIEQGIGRGTRGAGDYCVVLLLGDAQDWVSRRANASLMTPGTRAQLDLGLDVSKGITDVDDFEKTANLCLNRDPEWVKVHASELAQRSESTPVDRETAKLAVENARIERNYFSRFVDGGYEAARQLAERAANAHSSDRLFRGWLLQLAARASFAEHGHVWTEVAAELQSQATAANKQLVPPPGRATLVPLPYVDTQASRVAIHLESYEHREAYLAAFERVALAVTGVVPASDFEEAVRVLGEFLGFASERMDYEGEGPDNAWRTDDQRILILSCKNEKNPGTPLHKKDLSQLMIDAKWLEERHPELKRVLLLAHPSSDADAGLPTDDIFVLTTMGLSSLVGAVRQMAMALASDERTLSESRVEAERLLKKYHLKTDALLSRYCTTFQTRIRPASRTRRA